jgi:hypothetical protein
MIKESEQGNISLIVAPFRKEIYDDMVAFHMLSAWEALLVWFRKQEQSNATIPLSVAFRKFLSTKTKKSPRRPRQRCPGPRELRQPQPRVHGPGRRQDDPRGDEGPRLCAFGRTPCSTATSGSSRSGPMRTEARSPARVGKEKAVLLRLGALCRQVRHRVETASGSS